jgi:hypothetical protein
VPLPWLFSPVLLGVVAIYIMAAELLKRRI